MSEVKLYADRDIMQLDREGNHYCNHVLAMTQEGLHDKGDIAAELAFRDAQIDRVTAERDALQQRLTAADEQADVLEGLLHLTRMASSWAGSLTERSTPHSSQQSPPRMSTSALVAAPRAGRLTAPNACRTDARPTPYLLLVPAGTGTTDLLKPL